MSKQRPVVRFAALVVLVVGLAVAAVAIGLPSPAALGAAVERAGWLGPMLAVAGSAILVTAMVPRTALAATGGLLFGPLAGASYVLAGAAIGATVAFGAGRWLGRDFLLARRRGAAIDRWITGRATMGVLTLRLLPIAPFGLISYSFGATGVSFRAYLVGTALGAAPSTAVYASLGATALSPATPGFVISLLAAVTMGLAGTTTAALLARRRNARVGAHRG